jgi:hypothetical protein
MGDSPGFGSSMIALVQLSIVKNTLTGLSMMNGQTGEITHLIKTKL